MTKIWLSLRLTEALIVGPIGLSPTGDGLELPLPYSPYPAYEH